MRGLPHWKEASPHLTDSLWGKLSLKSEIQCVSLCFIFLLHWLTKLHTMPLDITFLPSLSKILEFGIAAFFVYLTNILLLTVSYYLKPNSFFFFLSLSVYFSSLSLLWVCNFSQHQWCMGFPGRWYVRCDWWACKPVDWSQLLKFFPDAHAGGIYPWLCLPRRKQQKMQPPKKQQQQKNPFSFPWNVYHALCQGHSCSMYRRYKGTKRVRLTGHIYQPVIFGR